LGGGYTDDESDDQKSTVFWKRFLAGLASLFTLNRVVPTAEAGAAHAGSVGAYSARSCHSLTRLPGHSNGGSAQKTAILSAKMNVASALAVIGVLTGQQRLLVIQPSGCFHAAQRQAASVSQETFGHAA
jgi:hypothetical protein